MALILTSMDFLAFSCVTYERIFHQPRRADYASKALYESAMSSWRVQTDFYAKSGLNFPDAETIYLSGVPVQRPDADGKIANERRGLGTIEDTLGGFEKLQGATAAIYEAGTVPRPYFEAPPPRQLPYRSSLV